MKKIISKSTYGLVVFFYHWFRSYIYYFTIKTVVFLVYLLIVRLLFCDYSIFYYLFTSKNTIFIVLSYTNIDHISSFCPYFPYFTYWYQPEGLAVGVAFGSLKYGLNGVTLGATCLLALGIGLQNFPEGTAISVPLRREGMSRRKAFFIGQLSGIVEPIAGVIGALLVLKVRYLLPFLLAFAAGAMIYVVVQELIPESQTNKRKDLMALFTLIGFSIMMILDVALG